MRITELKPMMWTEDLRGSVDFYTDVLGFTCGAFNEDWGRATLSIDDISIMLTHPNEHAPYERIGFTARSISTPMTLILYG
ncbi:MAG: VOC family protein [Blastocatellia bacterium]